MTHIIPAFAHATVHEKFRTLCGALVDGWEHAANGDPTCPECARLDAEDERSLLALSQSTAQDFGGPPEKPRHFNPTRGYRRRR